MTSDTCERRINFVADNGDSSEPQQIFVANDAVGEPRQNYFAVDDDRENIIDVQWPTFRTAAKLCRP